MVPVLVRQCPWKAHRWLKDRQMLPRDGKCVAIDFPGENADAVFAAVAEQVLAHFERLAVEDGAKVAVPESLQQLSAQRAREPLDPSIVPPPQVVPWPALPVGDIDLTRLPQTGSALFGRERELTLLDEAWASQDTETAPPVRVLAFTAHGGVGKSTLVNRWLAEMERDHYRGAERVFGWSFFSQGVREEGSPSAETFVEAALRFFGDEDPTAGSPWDRGARLAGLVGSRRALLVLDGLEPLQSAHAFERGKLKDPGVEALLRGLARQSAGLCLVTTREPLPDVAARPGVVVHDLEQIEAEAGRALLRTARVVGTDEELEELARRFGPHALAISLLGVYLWEQPGHGIGPARELDALSGSPLDRVLAGFEGWLGDGAERETLRLLGLFDRPADAGCMDALRQAPPIPDLTEHLAGLGQAEWERALERLQKLRLLHVHRDNSGSYAVDTHPLVREHFAAALKGSDSWRAAHRRLYEHLCAMTNEGEAPTLEDLQPLYQAVVHGCQAELQQEACTEVYWARIGRQEEAYAISKLGAFGSDLGAVACFFETPWNRVSPTLREADHAWLLNEAAVRLRALGRLTEAVEPMRVSGDMDVKERRWVGAAISYGNLSQLELTLGDLAQALADAEQAVAYADRSGDAFQRISKRATQADALHQAGHRAEAVGLLREAEQMQAEAQPAYPLLYSLRGFQYCDLLLGQAERGAWPAVLGGGRRQDALASCRAVSERTTQTLTWAEDHRAPLFDIALDHLTLGRSALFEAVLSGAGPGGFARANTHLADAVDGLRRAGMQDQLPRGLLTRAWLRAVVGKLTGADSAQGDLDEAWEIAERGPMPLFQADVHLYRARLFGKAKTGENYPWDSPQHDLAEARRLIEKHGYGRRKEELEDAEAALS